MTQLEEIPTLAHRASAPYARAHTGYIPALDGIRAVAVLMVMVAHTHAYRKGGCGVDMFFVLSGYLITALLLKEREATGHFSFKKFYIRRWLRLGPALFLLLTLYLLSVLLLQRSKLNIALGDSAIVLFYAANWTRAFADRPFMLGHAWSLSIEEQFYILWPALALVCYILLGRKKGAIFCAFGTVAVILLRLWLASHGATEARIYNGLDTRADGLLLGAAIAFFSPTLNARWASLLAWTGVAVLLIFLLTPGDYAYTVAVLSTAAILLGILNHQAGILSQALSFAPLAWVGKISYGLYLFHFPIMTHFSSRGWSPLRIGLVGFPMTFLVATLSFYLLERPCLRLKGRFQSKPDAAMSISPGGASS